MGIKHKFLVAATAFAVAGTPVAAMADTTGPSAGKAVASVSLGPSGPFGVVNGLTFSGTITAGDPATSTTPVAGVVAWYDGQIVPAGGVAIAPDQIAYDEGATILTVSGPMTLSSAASTAPTNSVTPYAESDCPGAPWVCIWADKGYGGRMLEFQDTGCHNLTDYGFNDTASSWINRHNTAARLWQDTGCAPGNVGVTSNPVYEELGPGGSSSYVGDNFNDDASSLGITS